MLSSADADSFFCFFCQIVANLLEWSTRMHKSSNFSSKRNSLKFVPFLTSHRCQLTSHYVGLSCIHQERCLQKVQSTQKIQPAFYQEYNPHERYKLHSTKSRIHKRGIHWRPWFGCDVRQCNDGMVTSTFVSFVFAKRFIEVEALYLQTQNSFA